jgi:acyl transferase domain-containing protein
VVDEVPRRESSRGHGYPVFAVRRRSGFIQGAVSGRVGTDDRRPVGVFSGQGSQWAQMGAELLATQPVFTATVAQAEPRDVKEYP